MTIQAQGSAAAPGEAGQERIRSIDALRGIMCVGIALNHFIPYFFQTGDVERHVAGYFAYFTDMFAVFAGLFAARHLNRRWSYGSFREYLVTRTARLYPLHVVTMSFYVMLAIPVSLGLLTPQNPARYSLAALLPHLTLTHAWGFGPAMAFNYPSWMISGIFGCYLAMPLLSRAWRRSRWTMLAVLVAALAISAVCAWALHSDITRLQKEGLGVLRTAPSFIFGLMLGHIRIGRAPKSGSALLLATALLFAFAVPAPLQGLERLAVVYTLVFAVLMLDRSQLASPLRLPFLQASGKFSFGVYLWHGVVATVFFRVLLPRLMGDSMVGIGDEQPLLAYLLIAGGVAVAFLLSAVSLRTVERHGARLFIWLWSGPHRQATSPA